MHFHPHFPAIHPQMADWLRLAGVFLLVLFGLMALIGLLVMMVQSPQPIQLYG